MKYNSKEDRTKNVIDLIVRLCGPNGLPMDDELRRKLPNDDGQITPRAALRNDLEDNLTDWIVSPWQYDAEGIPLADKIFHLSPVERAKDVEDALQVLTDGMPVKDRVRIVLAAKKAGYVKPWGRGGN